MCTQSKHITSRIRFLCKVMIVMHESAFHKKVLSVYSKPLQAMEVSTLQVNVGYRCNLTCKHCHVEGSPARTEMMDKETIDSVLAVLAEQPIRVIDITGGAPELNPHFRYLVTEARRLKKHIIARTNLVIFYEQGLEDFPEFYHNNCVELVASLPYYLEDNVDRIRGSGAFKKSIAALQKLNSLGYGRQENLTLNLVYNPQGAFLSPDQTILESEYKKELQDRFGIFFNRLYTFTNMPIGRFQHFLARTGNLDKYMDKLICSFNPATLGGIMCRHLISVGWDGKLYDCDFNQVLDMTISTVGNDIRNFNLTEISQRTINVGDQCFGCTAGHGST